MMASRCVTKGLLVSGTMALVCAIPICAASTVLPEPTPGLLAFTAGPIGADTPVLLPRGVGTTPVWHGEGGRAGDEYGYSVATAGDVNGDGYSDLIVGARHYSNGQTYEGAAYLYLGSANGLGTAPSWFVESNQSGAAFGVCVAPAGDVNNDGYDDVIIGADIYDLGQFDEGCAFVYLGSPTGLAATPVWTGQADQSGAQYGLCVATAGDVNGDGYDDVLVGAPFFDGVGADEGRAFLYFGTASGVSTGAAWTTGANQAGARYGRSVATAGDVNGDGYADVIIGAERFDGAVVDCGRAWIYTGSPAGLSGTSVWALNGERVNDHFGWCVATAGDVDGDGYTDVVIGAPDADSPTGVVDEGRAYVFRGAAGGPSYTPQLVVSGGQAGARYGCSVAPAGDTNGDARADLVVGAWGYDGGQTDEGRAFLYEGPFAGIFASPVWTGEIDQADARYGSSVATAGDVNGDGLGDVVVGTWGYDTPAANAGGAWVYAGRAEGLSDAGGWGRTGDQSGELLGSDVASAGDVNGDGYGDVAVSARERDGSGGVDCGSVWVHLGTMSGPASAAHWTGTGEQAESRFGIQVAPAGDVNGDGFSDLLIGASGFDLPGGEFHGKVYLYAGSATGLSPNPAWTAAGEQAQMRLGAAIAGAGDVNGDGYADVILGSASFTNPEFFEGKAMLYLGSAAGLGSEPAWEVEGNLQSLSFGISVSTAGDVNGDGYSDVIVGAYGANVPGGGPGYAYVYLGSPGGLAMTPAWTGSLGQTGDYFGISVSTAGDANGDGYDDVVVGASMYDRPGYPQNSGAVAVYCGSAAGLETNPDWFSWGAQADMHMGQRVCAAGDVNGDGHSDFGFSAPELDGSVPDCGMAYVKQGSPTGPSGFPEWSLQGIQASEFCGSSLASAGDANGDGFDDFIVGCQGYTPGGLVAAGRALLFLGNDRDPEFGGFPIIPRQQQQATQAPIDLLGRSQSLDGFGLAAMGRSAAGRTRVRLESRAAELGTPLGSLAIEPGAWTMSGSPAPGLGSQVALTAAAGGLAEDAVCHWHLRIGCRSPFFPVTPWMSTPRTVPSQHQLRTGRTVSGIEVDAAPAIAGGLRLEMAHPNPFADRTALAYTLEATASVRMSIHDISGRCVRVLVDAQEKPGRHVAHWDGRDAGGRRVGGGLYFVRVEAGDNVSTARIVRSR